MEIFLSRSMQRRDSLGATTKIPSLRTRTTGKFRTRRSRSTISSIFDVFADEATTKVQAGLSVSGMKLRSEKNLDGNHGRSVETGQASKTLTDPFEEGEQTLIRPDYHHHADVEEPVEDFEREEVELKEEASERSEVEPREELLFRGMSKSKTKGNKRRKEQSSLVKQSKNAMMSSIIAREEQTSSKAKKSWKSLYDGRMASLQTECLSSSYDHPEIAHSDVDFTPSPRNDKSKKALSNSPTRPMSDGIAVGASATFDRLTMSMGTQKGGGSSSSRLKPQLTSSSLGLTPVSGAARDISDLFAGVMTGLEELRRDMTKRIDRVEERAHQGQEKLRDERTKVKS